MSLSGTTEHDLTDVVVTSDFSGNRQCGVLISNASRVFVVDARIAGNDVAGIIIQGTVGGDHCYVADCELVDNPEPVQERHGRSMS